MPTTKTSICNLALDILKEGVATDVDTDATPEANWFVRNFEPTRDSELRKNAWKFAIKRATLTVDATAPAFDWLYRYALPSGCLRLLPLRYDGVYEGSEIPHEIEAHSDGVLYILTNQPTSLKVRYIYQVTDVTKFDPLFVEALAARLAMKSAHRFTGKQSMVATAAEMYNEAIFEARRANALEATPERPYDDDVIAARYTA